MEYAFKQIELEDKEYFRFIKYIGEENETGCMEWQAYRYPRGYGCFNLARIKTSVLAHRVAFWLSGQDFIHGMVIDHICRNKACINPAHLRQVTQQVNMTENSSSMAAINIVKTHCKRGHELSGDNLNIIVTKRGTGRYCRKCVAFLQRNYYHRSTAKKALEKGTVLRRYKKKNYTL